MYILCLISIDRYKKTTFFFNQNKYLIVCIRYFVVTNLPSATTITIKQTYLSILCAYTLALFWTLMPLIGWSSYDYEVWNEVKFFCFLYLI
jgi:hypothetical protein